MDRHFNAVTAAFGLALSTTVLVKRSDVAMLEIDVRRCGALCRERSSVLARASTRGR